MLFRSYSNGSFSSLGVRGLEGGGSLGARGSLDSLNQQFSESLGSVLRALGSNDSINTYSGVKSNKKGNQGYFSAGINGQVVGSPVSQYTNFGKADALQAIVAQAFGSTFVQALQASSLPESIKKFFNGLTDRAAVLDAANNFIVLKSAMAGLPPIFRSIQDAIDSRTLTASLATLKARLAAIGTYTDLFYSDKEKFDAFSKQVTGKFASLNQAVPQTREGFRQLVDGLDTTTSSGLALFNQLIDIAPTMDAYYKALQQQNVALTQATALTQDSFATLVDYNRYQAVAQNYGGEFAQDYTTNLSSGAINVGANGVAKVSSTGSTDIIGAIKDLRTAIEAVVIFTMQSSNILRKFDGNGMPEVRTVT